MFAYWYHQSGYARLAIPNSIHDNHLYSYVNKDPTPHMHDCFCCCGVYVIDH